MDTPSGCQEPKNSTNTLEERDIVFKVDWEGFYNFLEELGVHVIKLKKEEE